MENAKSGAEVRRARREMRRMGKERGSLRFDPAEFIREGDGVGPLAPDSELTAVGLSLDARQVLDLSLDAVICMDDAGKVTYFNPAAEDLFGYSAGEAIGRTVADLIVPDSLREAHRSGWQRLVEGGEPRLGSSRRTMSAARRDGSDFPVELTVRTLETDPVSFLAFIHDLSELQAAEAQLRKQNALLSLGEEMAGVGTFETGFTPETELWSENMFRIFGRPVAAHPPSFEEVLDQAPSQDRAAMRDSLYNPASTELEIRIRRPDGELRWLRGSKRIEVGPSGEMLRAYGAVLDITELRRRERRLEVQAAIIEACLEWGTFDEGTLGLVSRLSIALDADVGVLWLKQNRGELACRAFWSSTDSTAMRRFESQTRGGELGRELLAEQAWRQQTPMVINTMDKETGFKRRDAAEEAELRAGLALPAIGDRGNPAVFEFFSASEEHYLDLDLEELAHLGAPLGHLIDRHHQRLASHPLTPREIEVLSLSGVGFTTGDIAEQLVVTASTVKSHLDNIYEKLGVSSRAAAVAEGLRRGFVK